MEMDEGAERVAEVIHLGGRVPTGRNSCGWGDRQAVGENQPAKGIGVAGALPGLDPGDWQRWVGGPAACAELGGASQGGDGALTAAPGQ